MGVDKFSMVAGALLGDFIWLLVALPGIILVLWLGEKVRLGDRLSNRAAVLISVAMWVPLAGVASYLIAS